jgi:opacity protein-like surface antigen
LRTARSVFGPWVALAVLGLCLAAPAFAQPGDPAPAGWQVEISPYIWMIGITGDIQAGESSASIGASFSDILDSLDFGLMGMVQVRKGRVGVVFDGMYFRLAKDGEATGIAGRTVHGELVSQIYSLAVSYRALKLLDIVGGARLMPVSATLEVTSGALAGQQASGSNALLDGFVGARLGVSLMRRLVFELYGDVGAGGSKLSWQALGGLKIGLSKSVSAKIGYRALGIENETSDLQSKIVEGGFYLGIGFKL